VASTKFADKVQVVGVAWSGSDNDYAAFIERHKLSFVNLDDTAGDIYRKYEIPYQPAWVFVDTDGSVTTRRGALSESDLEEVLTEL
jgi:hypothetical protein